MKYIILIALLFCSSNLYAQIETGEPDVKSEANLSGENEVKEIDIVDRIVRTSLGNIVRVVGIQETKAGADVETTILGRVVEAKEATETMLCHIVIDAPEKEIKDPETGKVIEKIADMPELEKAFWKASKPVQIPGSKNAANYWYWVVILKGEDCILVADLNEYVGSTMEEFLKLTPIDQARLLRTTGTCQDIELGKQVMCNVPVGDPRATPNAAIFIEHAWLGTKNLNFVKANWDVESTGYKPDARIDIVTTSE